MRNAAAIFFCAGLFALASNAYAGEGAPAPAVAAAAHSITAPDVSANDAEIVITLNTAEQAELTALDTQSGVLLGQQSAGRACQGSGDTDCTRTTSCSSEVLTFGIVGVLIGSFGGAAGAVGGGVLGGAVGYGICASVN